MPDPVPASVNASQRAARRTALVGRVKMAKAMEMSETDWARTLADVERDPLFAELLQPFNGARIVKYRRFDGSRLSAAFYESVPVVTDGIAAAVEQKRRLMEIADRMGRDDFEKRVIHGEDGPVPDNALAQELILDLSAQTEAFHPSSLVVDGASPNVVGQICPGDGGAYHATFFSPHLARGLYDIDRPRLREWQAQRGLGRDAAARLRRIVGLMELSNMKQGAFWRVLERLLAHNRAFFETRDPSRMAPVSLRKVAVELDFAASTVSRVVSGKSILLPWGEEVLIVDLMPGQRRVVLAILEKLLPGMESATDLEISRVLQEAHGVAVSRRTITACRHIIESQLRRQQAA